LDNWEPSTQEYYLVFYHEIRPILDKFIQIYGTCQYSDFYELKDIGSGGTEQYC